MKTMVWIGVALLIAPARGAAQQVSEFRWDGVVRAGGTIEVSGINGAIRAGAGERAEVVAIRKAHRGNPEEVRIGVEEHAGGVRICAQYPRENGSYAEGCSMNHGHGKMRENDVEVEFRVVVPRGVNFRGGTVNGAINVKSLDGDVRVDTVNGALSVNDSRTVEANTVNGAIEASMSSPRWDGTLSLQTVNGRITLYLPASAGADIVAEAMNGGIETDFPLTIAAGERWGPKKLTGTIGGGGGRLELETVNGGIALRQR